MVKLFTKEGELGNKEIELPKIFETIYREDIIHRAIVCEESRLKQPQGRFPLAGRRVAAVSWGPGRAKAKIPRSTGSGTHHGGRGVLIHSAVGGRLLFPPSTEKVIVQKINRKEHNIAFKSAIAATQNKMQVEKRGHQFDEELEFPIVIEEDACEISKSTSLISLLNEIGIGADLLRCNKRKIRSGKGKMRGRKYKTKTGPLIIVEEECNLNLAGNNIPGLSVEKLSNLKVTDLAPGGAPARLVVWTEKAFERLNALK